MARFRFRRIWLRWDEALVVAQFVGAYRLEGFTTTKKRQSLNVFSNDLDWKKLRGLYGPAAAVPGHLERLVGDDPVARHHAVDALRRTLAGPRRPSAAGLELARLLSRQVLAQDTPERPRLLVLVVDLALGLHTAYLERGVNRSDPAIKKKLARGRQKEGYAFLADLFETFSAALTDPDPSMRAAGALALSFHHERATEKAEQLRTTLVDEHDEGARATSITALGLLAGYGALPFEPPTPQTELERAAVAIGACYAGTPLTSLGAELTQAMRLGGVGDLKFPFNEGIVDGHVAVLLEAAGDAGSALLIEGLCEAIDALAESSDRRDRARVHSWGQKALRVVLGRFEQSKKGAADPAEVELSEYEREVLSRLSRHDSAVCFSAFGLPEEAAARRRLLGVDPPTTLDIQLTFEVGGRPRTWPVWRAINATRKRELSESTFFKVLDANLSALERLDIVAAARVGDLDYADALVEEVGADWVRKVAGRLLAEATPFDPGQSRLQHASLLVLSASLATGALEPELDTLLPAVMLHREVDRVRAIIEALSATRREAVFEIFLTGMPAASRWAIASRFVDLCPLPSYAEAIAELLVTPGDTVANPEHLADALIAMGNVSAPAILRALGREPTHSAALERAAAALDCQ